MAPKAKSPERPGKLKLSRNPLGYRLNGQLRKGFPDDPALTAGQRLRIAGWARALAPDQLSEDQRGLLEGFTPRPSEARRRAEEESSYKASPFWEFLSDEQRKLIDDPSLHPRLKGVHYPLRTADLANLVGVSSDQIRYWNKSGLLPARRTAGKQRRFYAAAAMWAFLLADLGQPPLSVLRQVNEGRGNKFLAALSMLLREHSDAVGSERQRAQRLLVADNLRELALSDR